MSLYTSLCQAKSEWKNNAVSKFAKENSLNITSDRDAISLIENGTNMLKATLQKREQGECIIADLLDLDPEEYEAIQTSAAAAQQAAEQAAEESDDDNSVMKPRPQ